MINLKEVFAANLKRKRKELGYTQLHLAELTSYSEKTISKWESGSVIPSVETLYLLANVLNVSMESFFVDLNKKYFLGIDGGGTKTQFLLCDEKGNEICSNRLEGCNPCDIGIEESKKILKQGIYKTCGNIPLANVVLYAGISGGGVPKQKELLN
jgi:transcriptional regulator with XRE-family HTH domain